MPCNRIQPAREETRLPEPPAQQLSSTGFVCMPMGSLFCTNAQQFHWMQWLYMKALEEAQAVCKPSLPERDILGIWN